MYCEICGQDLTEEGYYVLNDHILCGEDPLDDINSLCGLDAIYVPYYEMEEN